MVDPFRPDNGATAFVSDSHRRGDGECLSGAGPANGDGQVLACGPAGSVVVYNGSVWHGHTANTSDEPRRSIQGAFIRRDARPATDFPARMRPDTLARIGPPARYAPNLGEEPAPIRRPGG
jgi:ectoine hydroxylase-related dioxygenase (phytanoyl-CoA dioxygenase family)